ncbi:MAG: PAS domain-containing sensor histidine [Geobacteraceae bacterium]|nr:MAG: PAS domain-containing sensor histidine [Geobacteraceae bacterium]
MRKTVPGEYFRESKAFGDLIIIVATAIVAFLLAMKFDLFRVVYVLHGNHVRVPWGIDEFLAALILLALALGAFSMRRWRELSWEVSLRTRLRGDLLAAVERAEREKAKTEAINETLQTMIHSSPLAVIMVDGHHNVLVWNPAAERLFGWSESEVVGSHLPTIPEHSLEEFCSIIENDLKGVNQVARELQRLRKDGSLVDVCLWTASYKNAGGEIIGSIGMFADITERKRMETSREESERRFYHILENVGLAAVIIDVSGRIVFCSDFLLELAEWGHAEVLGKDWFELFIPPEIKDQLMQLFAAMIGSGAFPRFHENEIVTRHGERRLIRWSNTVLRDLNGNVTGTASIGEDITDRKRAEAELRANQQQLASLAAELSLAEERERRRFASELHDQVGQTLAFTRIKLNSLAGTSPSDSFGPIMEIRDAVDQAIQEVRSLMFQISPPVLYEIGLESAIKWLCDWCREKYGFNVEFTDDNSPKPLAVEVRGTLFQAVRELLINSVKHAQTKNALISIKKISGKLVVNVEDAGVGFDVSTVLQGQVEKGGFGLFNIRQRIDHLGGEFEIASEIGRGTRVTILIPLAGQRQRETEENLNRSREEP